MEVRISAEAEADLQNQWLHLAGHASLESANAFEDRVAHVLELLVEQPQMGRARDELFPNCPAPKSRSKGKVSLPSLTAETSSRVVSRAVRIGEASSCRASHVA